MKLCIVALLCATASALKCKQFYAFYQKNSDSSAASERSLSAEWEQECDADKTKEHVAYCLTVAARAHAPTMDGGYFSWVAGGCNGVDNRTITETSGGRRLMFSKPYEEMKMLILSGWQAGMCPGEPKYFAHTSQPRFLFLPDHMDPSNKNLMWDVIRQVLCCRWDGCNSRQYVEQKWSRGTRHNWQKPKYELAPPPRPTTSTIAPPQGQNASQSGASAADSVEAGPAVLNAALLLAAVALVVQH